MMKCYGVGKVAGLGTVIILEDMGRASQKIQFKMKILILLLLNL